MNLEYHRMDGWPVLSWLAVCHKNGKISVYHGSGVETRIKWFCEAVWAGEFEQGGFDETDLVVGSGGRWRNGSVTFVSSGSTVDRLHHMERGELTFVSNSLPCLLAATGASLVPSYSAYSRDIDSITVGIQDYRRQLPTSNGHLTLTYFDNLLWNGDSLVRVPKPDDRRSFDCFRAYRTFLVETLEAVFHNGTDSSRETTFKPISTLSSGYDSAMIATLAQELGLRQVLGFDRSRGGLDDSGLPVAEHLGLEAVIVSSSAWRQLDHPEVPFIVGDGLGGEVYYAGAEEHLRGRLLLTGFHGDKVWGMDTKALGPEIVRGDSGGVGLSEYRLSAGFLNCVVPFWGVRQIREIHTVSNSTELKPWVLAGTDYNRPICRRIVEEAGVPRGAFGVTKKAADLLFGRKEESMLDATTSDYLAWLRKNRAEWTRMRKLPPLGSVRLDTLRAQIRVRAEHFAKYGLLGRAERYLQRRVRSLSGIVNRVAPSKFVLRLTGDPAYASSLHRHVFAWACETWKARYPGVEGLEADQVPRA